MSGTFFESVGIPNNVLYFGRGSVNIVHQVGEKIDGGFVNQMALAQYIQRHAGPEDNAKVLLVLTHQPKSHWTSVCHKLGVNLSTLQDQGTLVIFDLLKEVFNLTKEGKPMDAIRDVLNVENVYSRCEQTVQTFKTSGSSKILVIVEDLTNLLESDLSFSQSEKKVIEFLFKLRALAISSFEIDKCSITINSLIQSPEISTHSIKQSRLATLVAQTFSSTTFEVSPLRTGFSSQVTGLLKVRCSMRKSCEDVNNKSIQFIRSFHFKLDNSGVRTTPL